MNWIVDRIENDLAVMICEKSSFNVPIKCLPKDIYEGAVIYFAIDNKATKARKNKARILMDNLFDKSE